jgi:hypothetical protein
MKNVARNKIALRAASSVVSGNKKSAVHLLAGLALVAYAPGCSTSEKGLLDTGSTTDTTTAMDTSKADTTTAADTTMVDATTAADTTTVVDTATATDTATSVDTTAPEDVTVVVVDAMGTDAWGDVIDKDAHECVPSCFISTGEPCTDGEVETCEQGQCIEGECHHGQFVQEFTGEDCVETADCSGENDWCTADGECWGVSEESLQADACCMEAYNNLESCQIPVGCTPWGPTAPPRMNPSLMAALLKGMV